jgi:phosphatidate cytidylyltransferase
MMNNFWQRTLTGIVFVAVLLSAVWFGFWSFFGLLLLINFLGLYEFAGLFKGKEYQPDRTSMLICGSLFLIIAGLYVSSQIQLRYIIFCLPLPAVPFVVELYRKRSEAFLRACLATAGIIYISLSLSCFAGISHVEAYDYKTLPRYNFKIVLGYFLLIWSSDTFAYLSGRALGRTKLFPSVSPKKTWEGSIGGAVCTLGVAWLLHYCWGIFPLVEWLGLAAIIIIFGTWGDLIESMLKRNLGIKDSGNILPGHGGILDRFDSLLYSAPFAYAFLYFWSGAINPSF